jgi:hypothetical protein
VKPETIRKLSWPVLDEMPDGWRIDKTAGSPMAGCVFITNGRSVIAGQKRALLKVRKQQPIFLNDDVVPRFQINSPKKQPEKESPETARTMNELARASFKKKLLEDILVDLMICEIQGWSKREYIKELRELINGIAVNNNV